MALNSFVWRCEHLGRLTLQALTLASKSPAKDGAALALSNNSWLIIAGVTSGNKIDEWEWHDELEGGNIKVHKY